MNKLKEILISYAKKHNPTEDEKDAAEKRLEVCMNCDKWVQSIIRDYCSLCGCNTSAKVFSPVGAEACPLKKWPI